MMSTWKNFTVGKKEILVNNKGLFIYKGKSIELGNKTLYLSSNKSIKLDYVFSKVFPNIENIFDEKVIDLKGEIWKDVIGFEGLYEISNLGRVKRLNRSFERKRNVYVSRCIQEGFNSKGYRATELVDYELNIKTMLVHRLIAMAFIPNPENKSCINHINGIKSDNRIENLEWCTHAENMQHAVLTGLKKPLFGETIGKSILKEKDVIKILLLYKEGLTKEELQMEFKVSKSTIVRILSNKSWKHIPR